MRYGSARVVIKESEMANVWKTIEKYKVCYFLGSVFQVTSLLKHSVPQDIDISSLRVVIAGGVSFSAAIIRKLQEVIPGVIISPAYGMTEIGGHAITFDSRDAQDSKRFIKKPRSCGRPITGIWYKVVDPDTEEILGPNKPGELRLKTNFTMLGYYNMDSAECYDALGWLKTGDIFEYDEDHCFFMIERLKEMIRTAKGDIFPSISEHILMEHPFVHNAAVIGIPQADGYDFPMGIVTLHKNCDIHPKELVLFLQIFSLS